MTPTATRGRLTLGEVARRLGISPRSLSRLIASGELPVLRLSARSVRISRTDLAAYIEARREGAEGQPATTTVYRTISTYTVQRECCPNRCLPSAGWLSREASHEATLPTRSGRLAICPALRHRRRATSFDNVR
jgi:excisionase family DNA binding protein